MTLKLEVESPRVKGIDFHPSRPWVFYSTLSGDVNIYDYELKLVIQSYKIGDFPVRCVSVHNTQPIFACGTDKYDIIFLNWQKKVKLFNLWGHSDYIRSIQFHKFHPFILSASDDSEVRIWNWQSRTCIAILEEHKFYALDAKFNPVMPFVATACLDQYIRIFDVKSMLLGDSSSKEVGMFSVANYTLPTMFVGHSEGVNSVEWSTDGNRLFAVGENTTVYVLDVRDGYVTNYYTFDSLHTKEVKSVCYSDFSKVLATCSEDCSFKIFSDNNPNKELYSYSRTADRFWICTAHPTKPLIAAGHDSGFVIFQLESVKTVYDVQEGTVVWTKGNTFNLFDILTNETSSFNVAEKISRISWNPTRKSVIFNYIQSEPEFEVVNLSDPTMKLRYMGVDAMWCSRSSIIGLTKTKNQLISINYGSKSSELIDIPKCIGITNAGGSRVYIIYVNKIKLFDIPRKSFVAELPFNVCRNIVSNKERTIICGFSKFCLFIADSNLKNYEVYKEISGIKSVCFYMNTVFYTTKSHLKYIFHKHVGVICTLTTKHPIVYAHENVAWFIGDGPQLVRKELKLDELRLKLALVRGKHDESIRVIRENRPIGNSIMEFAADFGCYDIASLLATDNRTKFDMFIESNNLESAVKVADLINSIDVYKVLARKALDFGNISIAEHALKKAEDYDQLAFLYVITNQRQKLEKVAKITRNPLHLIWSNNDEELVALIKSISNIDLTPESDGGLRINYGEPYTEDWTLIKETTPSNTKKEVEDFEQLTEVRVVSDDVNDVGDLPEEDVSGWNVDLGGDVEESQEKKNATTSNDVTNRSIGVRDQWLKNAVTPGDLIAAGNFGQAVTLLKDTAGVKNFAPLRNMFIEVYNSCNASVNTPIVDMIIPISIISEDLTYPLLTNSISIISELMKLLFKNFLTGKFSGCIEVGQEIIRRSLLSSVNTQGEEETIKKYIRVAMNYVLGSSIEVTRRSEESAKRQLELASYLTHCNLEPQHLILTLQSALTLAKNKKNFLTARGFAERLLDMNPPQKIAEKCQQVINFFNKNPTNEVEFDYKEKIEFKICCVSKTPIYRGKQSISCPLCMSSAMPQYVGKLCPICDLSELGAEAPGLRIIRGKLAQSF